MGVPVGGGPVAVVLDGEDDVLIRGHHRHADVPGAGMPGDVGEQLAQSGEKIVALLVREGGADRPLEVDLRLGVE